MDSILSKEMEESKDCQNIQRSMDNAVVEVYGHFLVNECCRSQSGPLLRVIAVVMPDHYSAHARIMHMI